MMTIAGIVLDVALGAMAYRLARSIEKNQITLTAIVQEHAHRIDRLEDRIPQPDRSVGFIPAVVKGENE